MISISLCMIVKNEEQVIERCLNSVRDIVDEIIIVDTGSLDNTKKIAKKYTDNIYDFKWIDDFACARNFSFSKATKEYIFWMDADDVLLEEDKIKFRHLKDTLDSTVDSVSMIYNIDFDENNKPTFSYRRNRLVKNSKKFKWIGMVHDYLDVNGKIIDSDICITHKKVKEYTDRNLKIYKNMIEKNIPFTTRDILYYANELYDNKFYYEALKYYKKFLSSPDGWSEDKIYVCGKISDYYSSKENYEKAIMYCFKSFQYDTPRAENCCRLGYYFLLKNNIDLSIYWYELCTTLKRPENSWGFINEACWTWLPHLQLCVCYYKLGDYDKAIKHNEIAESINHNNEAILHNKEYFKHLLEK